MNNFPPLLDNAPRSFDNAVALDKAKSLLEHFPLRLIMGLRWLPDSSEWECFFQSEHNEVFRATRPTMADAIEFAVQEVLNWTGGTH